MSRLRVICLAFVVAAFSFQSSFVNGNFTRSMAFYFGAEHSKINGDDLQLVLDPTSGSGIQSKSPFMFGSIEMLIKLVPGNSAGTVTAYYLSSTGDNHDEIDFEFLGNSTGQPYAVHTNVYTQGHAGREQQFYLWFDPTADYHNYTIRWTPSMIAWFIDGVPIRVYRNYLDKGIPYPNQQGMRVYASIWNADSWATKNGEVKIDWSNAPFTAKFRRFRPRACYWNGSISISECATPSLDHWWNLPAYAQLSNDMQSQMNRTRSKYMIYDYCNDTQRYKGLMPGDCLQPQF